MAGSVAHLMARLCSIFLAVVLPCVAVDDPRELFLDFLTFPLQNVTAASQASDDLFTIVFIGDSEARMRGNTVEELELYIENLVSYKSTRVEYFDYAGGQQHRIDPQLVVLAGDISKDRYTSVALDWELWQPLSDNGIAFIAGFGNHDWAPYTVGGDSSNRLVTEFCRETYRNASVVGAPYFGYREFGPQAGRGSVTSLATFRGVHIVNFNTFLYEPSYSYDFDAISDGGLPCWQVKAAEEWEPCSVVTSAEAQIAELDAALDEAGDAATLFVQHYPMFTDQSWWVDNGASGTTSAQKQQRLKDLIGKHDKAVFLSGHNHQFHMQQHQSGGSAFTEYVAPYFGGRLSVNLNEGGGFLALLVSRTQGIVEVKHVPVPLYDANRTSTSTTLTTVSTATVTTQGSDTPSVETPWGHMTYEVVQACVVANCLAVAIACASDIECLAVGTQLLNAALPEAAQVQLATDLVTLSATNAVVLTLVQCVDEQCGTTLLDTGDDQTGEEGRNANTGNATNATTDSNATASNTTSEDNATNATTGDGPLNMTNTTTDSNATASNTTNEDNATNATTGDGQGNATNATTDSNATASNTTSEDNATNATTGGEQGNVTNTTTDSNATASNTTSEDNGTNATTGDEQGNMTNTTTDSNATTSNTTNEDEGTNTTNATTGSNATTSNATEGTNGTKDDGQGNTTNATTDSNATTSNTTGDDQGTNITNATTSNATEGTNITHEGDQGNATSATAGSNATTSNTTNEDEGTNATNATMGSNATTSNTTEEEGRNATTDKQGGGNASTSNSTNDEERRNSTTENTTTNGTTSTGPDSNQDGGEGSKTNTTTTSEGTPSDPFRDQADCGHHSVPWMALIALVVSAAGRRLQGSR